MTEINVIKTKARPTITTNDVEIPEPTDLDLPIGATYDRSDMTVRAGLEPTTVGGQLYMKELGFMEEMVTFMASEVTDPNAENPIPIGVNCEQKYITRGVEYTLPRKFLNVLICRQDRITTVNSKTPDGVDHTTIRRIPSLKYPVHVVKDESPYGGAWFQFTCKHAS